MKNSGKRGHWLWIALAVVLLLGGGAGAWWFMGTQQSAQGSGAGAETVEEERAPQEAHYLAMDKLLVNFDYQGAIHYVQTELQLMAYSEESLARARHNMPAVRNRLIMLLSEQDFAALRTAEGKEALRVSILDAVNEVSGPVMAQAPSTTCSSPLSWLQ